MTISTLERDTGTGDAGSADRHLGRQLDRHRTSSTSDLLLAARQGDGAAWATLLARYDRFVRSVIASFRLQEADALDALQSTWLRLFERAGTIQDPECLGGWLGTTATRECLGLLRRRREIPDDEAVRGRAGTQSGPDTALVEAETRRAVVAAVDELGDKRRRLVRELFFRPEAGGYAQISQDLGLPLGSIGPTRARTLRELRAKLERRGYGPQA